MQCFYVLINNSLVARYFLLQLQIDVAAILKRNSVLVICLLALLALLRIETRNRKILQVAISEAFTSVTIKNFDCILDLH